MNTFVEYTGEKPIEIGIGNFRGSFEPNNEYPIEDLNFANYLLGLEDFQLAKKRTKTDLMKLKRKEINNLAISRCLENPEKLSTIEDVADAILEAEGVVTNEEEQ